MSEARADDLYRRIEGSAFGDGATLRGIRAALPSEDLTDDERGELTGLCDTYLTEMATAGYQGEPAEVDVGDD